MLTLQNIYHLGLHRIFYKEGRTKKVRNQDGEWVTCSGGKERVECQGATKNILRARHPVVRSRLGCQGSV